MRTGKKKDNLAKSTFLADPIESLIAHLGHLLDNAKPTDIAELALIGALAYKGWEITKRVDGGLIAVVGYKLATTMGGTPPISQIAGLAVLGGLGIGALSEDKTQDVFLKVLGAGLIPAAVIAAIYEALPKEPVGPYPKTEEEFQEMYEKEKYR